MLGKMSIIPIFSVIRCPFRKYRWWFSTTFIILELLSIFGKDDKGISGFILHGLKFLSIKLFAIQGYREQSTPLFKPELDAVKMDPCLSQVYLCENECDEPKISTQLANSTFPVNDSHTTPLTHP